MIIWVGQSFANDHLDGPAFCKWPSGLAGLLQMIIRISSFQPDFLFFSKSEDQGLISQTFLEQCAFANDYTDGLAFCKWSSELASLLQMIIRMGRPFANDHPDFFFSTRFPLLLQIWGSRFNIAHLSRTMCFCWISNDMCIWSTKSSRRRQMQHSKFTSMPIHMIWLYCFLGLRRERR